MRQTWQVAAALALAGALPGCVMAVRHVAREANRSGVQDDARQRFAPGTSIAAARASLTAEGYFCRNIAQDKKTPAHISCLPIAHRTGGVEKFLIGGNWRWDFYGNDDMLTKVKIVSARSKTDRPKRPPTKTAPATPT